MTKFRALPGALATGTLILAFTQSVYAASSEIDLTGTQSVVDGSCVAPLPFFNGQDCSYNESNPTSFANHWLGPIAINGYYVVGQSPFALGSSTDPESVPVVGDNKYAVPFLPGSIITIEDNDTACDADDLISGTISLGATTHAFDGGQGALGEETWGDGDIVFQIPATTVDSATPNGAGGCDYEIADAGFPPLLQSDGGGTYLFDTNIVAEDPNDWPSDQVPTPDDDYWVASSPSGVACVSELNCGIEVVIVPGPGWSCVDNTDGNGACAMGSDGGPHFGGTHGTRENFLISVSTDGNGDITTGTIFSHNESKVFTVPPDPFNSWDGPLLTFTGTCNNCKLASDDFYNIIEGAGATTLDIGANDSATLVDPTTITITAPPPAGSVTNVSAPGDIKTMTVDYTPPAGTGTEQFEYSVNDGVNPEAFATVTVTVEPDLPVNVNPVTLTLDTEGVDPSTQSGSFNALTDNPPGNDTGNNGAVTAVSAASLGTATTDGTNVTYTPGSTFFSGTDTFTYTITDDQGDNGTETVTVNIADVDPSADDAAAETEADLAVDIPISFDLGNGSLAQHTVTAVAGSGTCTVDLGTAIATYTPAEGSAGEDTCTYTLADGDGSSDDGVIIITVEDTLVIKFPGGSALDPWSLALLLGLPLLRRRRAL